MDESRAALRDVVNNERTVYGVCYILLSFLIKAERSKAPTVYVQRVSQQREQGKNQGPPKKNLVLGLFKLREFQDFYTVCGKIQKTSLTHDTYFLWMCPASQRIVKT